MQRERRKQRILEVASLHAAPSKKSGRITSLSAPRHPPKKPLLPLLPLHFKVLVFKVLFFIRVHSRLRPFPDCYRLRRSCRLSGLTRRDHDGRQGWAFFLFSGADFG